MCTRAHCVLLCMWRDEEDLLDIYGETSVKAKVEGSYCSLVVHTYVVVITVHMWLTFQLNLHICWCLGPQRHSH